MKLSKAQQEVLEDAMEEIDFARTHSFYDWYRKGFNAGDLTNEEINARINDCVLGRDYFECRYNWNREGIDYTCHASSATIRKLETLGLIEILYDSNGSHGYGLDRIRILNY